MPGEVMLRRRGRGTGATLLPVDSEHNAIFQALEPRATATPSSGSR